MTFSAFIKYILSDNSIADEAFCYEKYDRSVSSSLWDTLDGQGKLSYPMRLIHNVGHCFKNTHTLLERGTHLKVTLLMIPKIYG